VIASWLLENPFMPQQIACDQCGQPSVVHTLQYVYQRTDGASGDTQHVLKQIVMVIECPRCGVHSQITDVDDYV
jgi:hypothetical protein